MKTMMAMIIKTMKTVIMSILIVMIPEVVKYDDQHEIGLCNMFTGQELARPLLQPRLQLAQFVRQDHLEELLLPSFLGRLSTKHPGWN